MWPLKHCLECNFISTTTWKNPRQPRSVHPYGMFDFEYRITLPQSKKILKAQNGEDKGEYKLTDLHMEYEITESKDRELQNETCMMRQGVSSDPRTSLAENFTRISSPASWTSEWSTTRASVEAGAD